MRDDRFVGTTIDRYRVESLIGAGGFGNVYLAEHTGLDRHVALKVLRDEWIGDPAAVERFVVEARLAARTSHPNLVAIYDVGHTSTGVHYIAMENVRGRTLCEIIRAEAPVLRSRAIDLVAQTLAGLDAAHREGIVHADLKPGNLIVNRYRDRELVKIIDFGAASPRGRGAPSETLCGTPAYLAPELARGRPADVPADLYAVGIILYELLTGEPPFTAASSIEVIRKHVRQPFEVPPRLRHRVTEALETFLERALAKDPDARFASADHMRTALMVAASDEPTRAPTAPMPATRPRAPRAGRDRPPRIVADTTSDRARINGLRRAIERALASSDAETLIRCYARLADVLVARGAPSQAAAELDEGVSLATSCETADASPLVVRLAELAYADGDLDRALERATDAYRQAQRSGRLLIMSRARALVAELRA